MLQNYCFRIHARAVAHLEHCALRLHELFKAAIVIRPQERIACDKISPLASLPALEAA
jgi:hypothetical protein